MGFHIAGITKKWGRARIQGFVVFFGNSCAIAMDPLLAVAFAEESFILIFNYTFATECTALVLGVGTLGVRSDVP